jgi:hypothetical protein
MNTYAWIALGFGIYFTAAWIVGLILGARLRYWEQRRDEALDKLRRTLIAQQIPSILIDYTPEDQFYDTVFLFPYTNYDEVPQCLN